MEVFWQIPDEVFPPQTLLYIQKLSRKLKTGRTMPKETHAIPWSLRHDLAIAPFWIWSVSWLSNSYTGYNGKGIFSKPQKRIGKVEEKDLRCFFVIGWNNVENLTLLSNERFLLGNVRFLTSFWHHFDRIQPLHIIQYFWILQFISTDNLTHFEIYLKQCALTD